MRPGLDALNAAGVGEAVEAYLLAGLDVLPLLPGSKKPAIPRWTQANLSLWDYPTEEWAARAQKYGDWAESKKSNVGLLTGILVDVLDVDVKHGKPGAASIKTLESAGLLAGCVAIARTPSGGTHYYFPANGGRSASLPAYGLDWQTKGRQVAAAPSSIVTLGAGGIATPRYEWLWSRPLLEGTPLDWQAARRALGAPEPPPASLYVPGIESAMEAAERMAAWLCKPDQLGDRNSALYWAAGCVIKAGGRADELSVLVDASLSLSTPGEDRENELWATIDSALKRHGCPPIRRGSHVI